MLFRNSLAIRAPDAVAYDGGGVYLGGASSNVNDTGLLSNVTATAGIADEPFTLSVCLLFAGCKLALSDRGIGYRCGRCDEVIAGRYNS